jgi:L-lactate dehydrogenase complex protein LldF
MLFRLRSDVVDKGLFPLRKRFMLLLLDQVLYRRPLYHLFGFLGTRLLKYLPAFLIYNRFNAWGKSRDIPEVPPMRFRDWYKKEIMHE